MEIYTEETSRQKGKCIIVMDAKEAQALQEMCELACETNKRKTSWKEILQAVKDLACW